MSNFWGKVARLAPHFDGTEEESAANVASHNFQKVYLKDKFPEVYDQSLSVISCSECGVTEESSGSRWPCGAVPDPVTFNEYMRQSKARNPR